MDIFNRIIAIILPVFIIIGLGYAYARYKGAALKGDMLAVNRVSMDVLCPLLVFTALAAKDFDVAHNAWLILAGCLIALGSGLLAWPVARLFGYDVRSFVPPHVQAALKQKLPPRARATKLPARCHDAGRAGHGCGKIRG